MQIQLIDKKVTLNPNQEALYLRLKDLANQILAIKENKKSVLDFLSFSKKAAKNSRKNNSVIKSLYIHGAVGRGKSMLVMNFFQNIPIKNKVHFHFNSFMQEVHKELHRLRKSSKKDFDLIELATKNILKNNRLLYLDEFQVEDVADAMILNRMFSFLFESGIILVTTSNSKPTELYKNGLQRDLFLKFVHNILEKHCQIINLDGEVDYRGIYLHLLKRHYFHPANSANKKEVLEIFSKAIDHQKPYPREFEVLGRKLIVKNSYKNIAMFSFKELCETELGTPDYQAICQNFDVIFLLNIPKLKKEDRNEAKRLILFIDEAYENKIDLVILADVPILEIYEEGIGAEAFKRASSRLSEITSHSNKD